MGKLKKAFLMIFPWHILSVNNLWYQLFKARYVRKGHLVNIKLTPIGLIFWKAILNVVLEVYENGSVKIREGNVSLWFNKWFHLGPLAKTNAIL